MPLGVVGPFVELSDGSLLIVEPTGALTSSDDGKTWSDPTPITSALKSSMLEGGMLIRTSNGVIILMFVDRSTFSFGWDDATGKPADNVKGDVWSIRSLDEGKTWTDLQMVMQGYCGAIITIIQTCTGEVVAPVQRLLYDPGRHATSTYVSTDDGASWSNSNTIDLGGHGHHDGAFEATLAELKDGRLMMLIRTTLDRFWDAYSEDKGRSWLEFRPSDIEASNTPAYLARLSSGRLALVWNRLYPEGETMAVRRLRPCNTGGGKQPPRRAVHRLLGGRGAELVRARGLRPQPAPPGRDDAARRQGDVHGRHILPQDIRAPARGDVDNHRLPGPPSNQHARERLRPRIVVRASN